MARVHPSRGRESSPPKGLLMSFFRVTSQTYVQQTLASIQQNSRRSAELQAAITSGLKIQAPSDDPVAFREWKLTESEIQRMDSYLKNIQSVRSRLDNQVSQMIKIKELMTRAKTLALEAPGSSDRNLLATEIAQLRSSLFTSVNERVNGRYLFAGAAYDRPPFAQQTVDDRTVVVYQGSTTISTTLTGDDLLSTVNLVGSEIFGGAAAGGPVIMAGPSQVAPGVSGSNGSGVDQLIVAHGTTSYAAGSGVQPGLESASRDTVIGPPGTHRLTINDLSGTGAAGTVSLNGGPEFNFSSSDTNLAVRGAAG